MPDILDELRLERNESIYRDPSIPPASKEKILDAIARSAYNYERSYSGCTRSVLSAINDHLYLVPKDAFEYCFKASSTLPGGIARMGEVCGTLTGALMAIGLAFGPEKPQDTQKYATVMKLARQFFQKFNEKFEQFKCRELLKKLVGKSYDFWNPQDREEWIRNGGPEKCALLCAEVARMAAEFIIEVKERQSSS